MRPVEKGTPPDLKFKKYQDAELFLEKRLGPYCSFCEFPIHHVPEVEHKEAKTKGGKETDWENLLLSCKYCNTRKGVIVEKGDRGKYLWPDEDDTFHVFLYSTEIPQLNKAYLKTQGKVIQEKAENLFHLIKLDHIPLSPTEKDRRYSMRNEARNYALNSKAGWDVAKQTSKKMLYLQQIEMLAKASGFFSVWMNVFKDDIEVKKALIAIFKGTKEEFCLD